MNVSDELYTSNGDNILKGCHMMFVQDVVKDLNAWRNEARGFRNKNALLLKEIGELKYPKPSQLTDSKDGGKK